MRNRYLFQVLMPAVLLAGLTGEAQAHRLKLFARVEDGTVQGYGFFIGGGRPGEAQLVIRNSAGTELFRGPTQSDGSFRFTPAVPDDLDLTINAGDGHMADAHIAADRFPPGGSLNPIGDAKALEGSALEAPTSTAPPQEPDARKLAQLVDQSVDRAVSRQIEPLLEAYAQADGRARFSDVVSGIAVIIGLAGLWLWGSARRRSKERPSATREAE